MAQSFSLTASPTSVASGDFNGDGHPDLIVTRQGSGSISVLLGNGKGSFSAGVDYAAGTSVSNALVADFNGDGKLDVAVTDSATGSIDVLFGNGDGTFGKPDVYAGLGNALSLAAGRFTSSGKVDLAVASSTGVDVLLNDGTGHFSAAAAVAVGSQPRSLAAADLKAAGHDDLIVANQDGTLIVLLGDGSGHFSAQPAVSAAHGPLSSVIASDFNADGKIDLAVAQANSNAVTVLLGRGDGSFESGVNYAVGNGPVRIISADVNGDGAADLVSVNQISNTFSVLLGKGDGTFRPSVDFVAGNSPLGLVAGDFNADGHADLAIVNSQDQTLAVPLGRGDGTFIATPVYRADLLSKAIAAGDLNGDGRPDLVVTNFCGADSTCVGAGTATIFLANADGTYRAASTIALGVGPVSVALADLNGDKKLDLIALNSSDKTMSILAGNGDGTFGKSQLYSLAASPRAIFVGDFNGDGKADLAIASDCGQSACNQPGTLDIWLGRGDLSVAASASYTVGYSPVSIAAADLRSTGHLDVVVANACGDDSSCKSTGTATLLSNDGTGHFTAAGEVALGSAPSSIAIGNLSGSGLDLAVAERGSNQVAVLHADGKGGFGAPVTYAVGAAPSAITIADINGDGHSDVAVAGFQSSTVSVLYGSSSGKLEPAVSFPVGAGPESLVAVSKASGTGLVTANGDTGADPMGSGITALGGSTGTGTTTVAFTTTSNTANVDQQVTITGSVTAVSPAGTPTGTLVFAIDTSAGGTGAGPFTYLADCGGSTGVTLTAGSATCTTQLLPASAVNIQLQYSGDTTYATNTSATDQAQTISPADTTVTVGATTTGTVDQLVTLTATVAPSTTPTVATNDAVAFSATGTIEFFSDGTLISGCGSQLVTNNAASENASAICQTTALNASGSPHAITAAYNTGDPNYNGSVQSLSVNQTIQPAATAVTVTSASPAAPTPGQSVTFSATVAPSSGSVVIPFSGSMTFYVNGTAISTCTGQTVNTTTGVTTCNDTAGLAVGTQQITAAYNSGDTNYNASVQSSNFPVTVSKAGTKVTVNSTTPSAPTVDQTFSISATVAPSSGTSVGPFNGTMSFSIAGTAISTCAAQPVNTSTGVSTCNDTAGIGAGSQQITATYSGDSTYAASSPSANFSLTVGTAPTSATISASPIASNVDQSVTLTAVISPNVTSNEVATANIVSMNGKVQFSDAGTAINGCATQSVTFSSATGTATATCITGVLAAGTHSALTANYLGDSNYSASANSAAATVTVSKEGPSVVVTASPSAPTLNNPVTYTATITFPSPLAVAPTNTDTVQFADNGTNITGCATQPITVTATSNVYQATCGVSSLTGGSHSIVATFSGDANYLSEIGNLSVSVGSASSTTTVSASPSPSAVNTSVTFTVTVMGGNTVAVSGTASVSADGNLVGQCTLGTWTAATGASCPVLTASLSQGTHSITASYSGNSSYNPSSTTAPQLQEVVNKAGTNLTVSSSSSGNSSTINTSVTFSANITLPAGTITPGGTVLFTDTPSGSPTTNICATSPISLVSISGSTATYTAACPTSSLALGPHTITATYSGDGSFSTSTNTTTQTVTTANSNTAVTAVLSTSVVDETVSFQATVTAPSGNATPTGTMAFTDTVNGVTAGILGCGSVPLVSGTYVCSTNTLIQGVHTITANYPGDLNFQKSSASTTQTVNKVGSSLTLVGTNNTVSANNVTTLTFTATVAPNAGPIYPTGNVVFTDTSGTTVATLCTSPLSATGVATCVPTTLPSGTNTITAAYAGDANFAAVSAPGQPTFAVAVQDFTLTLNGSVSGGAQTVVQTVTVTQSYQSTTDLFTPVTLALTPASISAYSGTVTLTCTSPSTGAPKCTYPPSLALSGSGTPVPGTIVIDATSATPGSYAFTLTGTDSVTGLSHSVPFTVNVRALATPIGVVSGATTGNTSTVNFALPAGVSLSNLECLSVIEPGVITKPNVPPSAISATCSFNPTTIASSSSLQIGSTVVTVSTGTTTASLTPDRSSGLLIAGLFGIPIFGLLGFRRGRKSVGSVFLRLIAILALTAAAYQVMGCGGSFSRPPVSQGQTPAGQYFLLIQGTGTPGNGTYQAVVELNVSL